jgi:SPX domain protein involved in polyphosphate accumulation
MSIAQMHDVQALPGSQSFARYEFKYLLRAPQAAQVQSELSHFMTADEHASQALDDQYFVRSLYFENAACDHFYEKIDGIKTRRKYRLRTYGNGDDVRQPVYLEEKGRHNERTYKQRVEINRDHLELFLEPGRCHDLLAEYRDLGLIQSFVFDCARRRLSPTIIVDYERKAFTSQFDVNFRVTFDRELRISATSRLFPPPHAVFRQCVPGWTIMEIKFLRRQPAWFHRILQAHGLHRISFSKFVQGMKVCGRCIDLS